MAIEAIPGVLKNFLKLCDELALKSVYMGVRQFASMIRLYQ